MLYLIDEYIAELNEKRKGEALIDPSKRFPELLRFKTCKNNLHEMTLEEVQAIVSKWKPVSEKTAKITRRKIDIYLRWLEEKGLPIGFDISQLEIPTKAEDVEFVFSTKDLQMFYDILYAALERKATIDGKDVSTQIFNMTHAAGILAFYGLSDEEIYDLDLSDVQPDGIMGYDLPLTQDDIDVLMRYKNMRVYDNRRPLKGCKYIRAGIKDGQVNDSYYINRPLSKINVEDEFLYLRTLLKTSTLNLNGKFAQAYEHELKYGESITENGDIPNWFKLIFNASINWRAKLRKEYLEYRRCRHEYVAKQNAANDKIITQLNGINEKIAKLNKEAKELRKHLL